MRVQMSDARAPPRNKPAIPTPAATAGVTPLTKMFGVTVLFPVPSLLLAGGATEVGVGRATKLFGQAVDESLP